MIRKIILCVTVFTLVAGSAIGQNQFGGNKPASAGGTGINSSALQPRWTMFTAPVTGTIVGIGGWLRNDGTGSEDVCQFLLADTNPSAPTYARNIIDSTDRFTLSGNGTFGNFTSSQYAAKIGVTVTSGKRYMIAMLPITTVGNCYSARDNSGSGYVVDSTWLGPTFASSTITNPIAASGAETFISSGAQCYWVEIQPSGGGGGGGNGTRVVIRK